MEIVTHKTMDFEFRKKFARYCINAKERRKYLLGIQDEYTFNGYNFDPEAVYEFNDNCTYNFVGCKNVGQIVTKNSNLNFDQCSFNKRTDIYAPYNNVNVYADNYKDKDSDLRQTRICANSLVLHLVTYSGHVDICAEDLAIDYSEITNESRSGSITFTNGHILNTTLHFSNADNNVIVGDKLTLDNTQIMFFSPGINTGIIVREEFVLNDESSINSLCPKLTIKAPNTIINDGEILSLYHGSKDDRHQCINFNGILCRKINSKNIDRIKEICSLNRTLTALKEKAQSQLDVTTAPLIDKKTMIDKKIERTNMTGIGQLVKKRKQAE